MKKTIGIMSLMILGMLTVSAASPIAVDDTVATNEDTPVVINVITNDTDADLDILTATSLSNVTNWTATITSSWIVTFTPTLNFNWTWSFDYIVSDWTWSDIGNVTVTVNPVNDSPVVVDDTFSMVKNTTATINLTWNDTDVDGNALTVTSLWTILNWVWTISSTWTWVVFTPSTNFVWVVSFDYTVSDWTLTDLGQVTINVNNIVTNTNPDAKDDYVSVLENTSKTFDPRINDIDKDGDILTITWVTNPSHGTISFTSTSITYTPSPDYYGSDTFNYTIIDSKWWTDTAKVKINVYKDNSDDEDEDEDDDEDDDDYGYHNEKHVRNIQKEFQWKMKELKNRYKHRMSSSEYKKAKNELQNEYKNKLKEVTGKWKKDDDSSVKAKYKYQWDTSKSKYKNEFQKKYWSKISSLSDDKLTIIIWKIDKMISDVNSWNYSAETKAKTNTMLLALRELVVDYMNDNDNIVDIDSLFE